MTRVMGYCLFSFFKCGIFSCYAIFVHCLTNSRVCLPVRCRICIMSSNTLKYCELFVGHCRGIWIDWLSCVLLVDWIEWCLLCVLFIHLLIHWSIDPLIHWSIDPLIHLHLHLTKNNSHREFNCSRAIAPFIIEPARQMKMTITHRQ